MTEINVTLRQAMHSIVKPAIMMFINSMERLCWSQIQQKLKQGFDQDITQRLYNAFIRLSQRNDELGHHNYADAVRKLGTMILCAMDAEREYTPKRLQMLTEELAREGIILSFGPKPEVKK